MQTEFEFTLPKGYLDDDGVIHCHGVMRLSRAMDEIVPLRDPRVKSNPAYATVMILSRVIIKLGALEEVTPRVVEQFFTCDLDYLQKFYRQINELEAVPVSVAHVTSTAEPEVTPLDHQPNASSSTNAVLESVTDFFSPDGGPPMVPPSPRARTAASQS